MNCDPGAVGASATAAMVYDDGAVERGTLSSTSADIVPSVGIGEWILLLLLKEEILVAEPRPRRRFLYLRRYRTCGEMKRSFQ